MCGCLGSSWGEVHRFKTEHLFFNNVRDLDMAQRSSIAIITILGIVMGSAASQAQMTTKERLPKDFPSDEGLKPKPNPKPTLEKFEKPLRLDKPTIESLKKPAPDVGGVKVERPQIHLKQASVGSKHNADSGFINVHNKVTSTYGAR